jgi:hypothetical protein
VYCDAVAELLENAGDAGAGGAGGAGVARIDVPGLAGRIERWAGRTASPPGVIGFAEPQWTRTT